MTGSSETPAFAEAPEPVREPDANEVEPSPPSAVSPDPSSEPDRFAAGIAADGAGTPMIDGHELLRVLGRDEYGETWLARRPGLRLLAVRVIRRANFKNEETFAQAFKSVREYVPASRADGNSVEILQIARTAEFFYYVTPLGDDLPMRRPLDPASPQAAIDSYVPRTLHAALERGGSIPADECLRIAIYLTAALETLHRLRRVHGAVRPSRILFVNGDPKLREPGFETMPDDSSRDTIGGYAAPEGSGTPEADVYSLGRVLGEISARKSDADSPASGRRPAAAADKASLTRWKRILAKACAANPAKRYQSAQSFHDDLAALLAHTSFDRTRWSPAKMAAVAALIIAAGVGVAHYLNQPARTPEKTVSGESALPQAPAKEAPIAEPSRATAAGTIQSDPAPAAEVPPGAPLPEIAQMPPAPAARSAEGATVPVAAGSKAIAMDGKTPPTSEPASPPRQQLAIVTPPVPPIAPAIAMPENAAPTPIAAEPETPRSQLPDGQPWTNSLGMKFVPVGSVHFCIWETRVKDYEAYCSAMGLPRKRALYEGSDSHPVVQVSWHDAKAFCDWLTKKEINEGTLAKGQSYRLPTDIEWSMAIGLPPEKGRTPEARDGGIKNIYPWGGAWPPPPGAGNFADASVKEKGSRTIVGYSDGFPHAAPVGSFPPNRLGLYDMAGNVWQWCEETYGTRGTNRVTRGGSWADDRPAELLSSYRNSAPPDTRGLIYGFRCVLTGLP